MRGKRGAHSKGGHCCCQAFMQCTPTLCLLGPSGRQEEASFPPGCANTGKHIQRKIYKTQRGNVSESTGHKNSQVPNSPNSPGTRCHCKEAPCPWKRQTLHAGTAALWLAVAISPSAHPHSCSSSRRLPVPSLPSLEAGLLPHLASFISKCQLTQIQSSQSAGKLCANISNH